MISSLPNAFSGVYLTLPLAVGHENMLDAQHCLQICIIPVCVSWGLMEKRGFDLL
jgi:hypothetical protein